MTKVFCRGRANSAVALSIWARGAVQADSRAPLVGQANAGRVTVKQLAAQMLL